MSSKSQSALARFTSNPYLNIIVGLIFLATGIIEIVETVDVETSGTGLGAHHGAALFGLWHAIKHLPEIFEGLEYVQKPE